MTTRARRVARLGHLVGLLERKTRHEMHRTTLDLLEASERADLLRDYQDEYAAKLLSRGNVMSAEQLGNYYRFLDNLAAAIDSQALVVQERRRAVDAREETWRQDRRKLESVKRAASRRLEEARGEQARVEQRQVDDLVGTRHAAQPGQR